MAQYSKGDTPAAVAPDENLTSRLWVRAAAGDARQIMRWSVDSQWRGMDWPQLADRVREVAAGLIALGIGPGDRVALMSNTRMEWTVTDLAILSAGAVTVPLYETSSLEQCAWILSDSAAKAAVVATADQAKQMDTARAGAPGQFDVFVLDDGGLDALAERGDATTSAQVADRVATTSGDDLASIIYTSGTTGNPKGCSLTHGNLLSTARQSETMLPQLFTSNDSTLLFLPLAHVLARIIQFACLEANTQLGYARSLDTLVEDLSTFRPTFLLAVPRVFEKVFNSAQRKAEGGKRKVFDFAVATSQQWASTATPGRMVNLKRGLADKLVYSKLRGALGGQVRYCVSGGAPLSPHLAYFFHAAGITILEGYGLTETSAASAFNTPTKMRIGTVGRPNAGTEVKVAEDGELLIRGPGVFDGYWNNKNATAEILAEDGWLRTGDIGEIDDDGYITITGRKKEIIVTAGGKNVAPAVLEERLKSHRLVSQAMVVGDNRAFVAALVTLEPDELAAFAKEHELSGSPAELAEDKTVRAEVDTAIKHANAAVSQAESIRKVTVLPRDFTIEDGEMTPTLKLKRSAITEHFANEIEGLYR
ncbi:MAG: long-chain fatty acid--CoA ligase [Actinomycetota bacterium]|jgi:long-chain acyl-CoA synthetase|nr:long-chain fatty acid--CoA ligase [Actinomycetota bacterium]